MSDSTPAHLDPTRRHDFLLLFDVENGNPNGDPDAGNMPRVDHETQHGLVSDGSIKRKVRDFVDVARGEEGRFKIYVQRGSVRNAQQARAFEALGDTPKKNPDSETRDAARAWMCKNFYDIRTFGAMMSTGVNCGQVIGPVQINFARSVDPILPQDVAITCVAVTTEEQKADGKDTMMGRKALVHYALYLSKGFITPHYARSTGFDEEDLSLLWQALQRGFDLDRSASRGMMSCRGIVIFSHENPLGNARAPHLFERLTIEREDATAPARSFSDYLVEVDDVDLPDGVEVTRL